MNNVLSIKDLENLSGIKAHTIRMWEKRYSIFEPKRTQTNIRYYDNEDLKKLLNITTILDNGMRISQVSTLSQDEINDQILKIQAENLDAAKNIVINELVVSTLTCDSISFENTFIQYKDQHGFKNTIEKVLYPMLVRIGLMWSVSKLSPAQEHFASQLIKQKLFSAINDLKVVASEKKYLIYLPEKEYHEIGILYAHFLIKYSGYHAIYLGPSVPLIDVIECAKNAKATDILCSFTLPRTENRMTTYLNEMTLKLSFANLLVHYPCDKNYLTAFTDKITFLSSLEDLNKQM